MVLPGRARRDLVRYLDAFNHTFGVMQTADALHRVAAECAEDLAADGVVYAEVRFAPELHLEAGLDPRRGRRGRARRVRRRAARPGHHVVRALLTAMRTAARSLEIAELAVRWRDDGVVGSTSPAPRPATRRPATSTPSSS